MARRGAIDRDRRTPIKWTRGPPDLIKHMLDWASYNGPNVSDVARQGATDQTGDRSHALWTTDDQSRTWRFSRIITAEMRRRGSHLSRRIVIQGAKSKHFYNANPRGRSEPSIQIGRLGLNRNGPRWTVSS